MQRFIFSTAILLFAFILWVIFMANTGQDMLLFEITRAIPFGDKLGHVMVFGSLTLMANLAFKGRVIRFKLGPVYYGALMVLAFVTLEELSQYFIATRSLDMFDYLANLLGILGFSWLTREIIKKASFFNEASP
jgi:VanZ family protein